MLVIEHAHRGSRWHVIAAVFAVIILIMISLYITALYFSPALSLGLYKKPLSIQSLGAPTKNSNQLILPKIGVIIPYSNSTTATKDSATWHQVANDTPKDDANVVFAAYRFNLEFTPTATVAMSPFYNIDRLAAGDTVFVDYDGARYAYEVNSVSVINASEPPINTAAATPTLTLYTLGEGEKCSVVTAKKLGQVQT